MLLNNNLIYPKLFC